MIQKHEIVNHESRVAHRHSNEYRVHGLCAHLARTQYADVENVCDHTECADHHAHPSVVWTVDAGRVVILTVILVLMH
jgi:hypothetical protein